MAGSLLSCILFVSIVFVGCIQDDDEPDAPLKFSLSFLESLIEKCIRMEIKMESMAKELEAEKEIRQLLLKKLDEHNCLASQTIAFRVHLSHNLGQITSDTVIKFDQVDLNIGRAYDECNGIFTAPLNGTYLFSMALGNPANSPGAFFMRKSGIGIEYAIAGHTTGWNMGSVTTVDHLVVGDRVWVTGEGHVSGAYPTARYHTSFSGLLVHKDPSDVDKLNPKAK